MSNSLPPHGLYVARQAPLSWNTPGKNTGVDSHSLLQGIFSTQGWDPVSCIAGRFFTIWVTRDYLRPLSNCEDAWFLVRGYSHRDSPGPFCYSVLPVRSGFLPSAGRFWFGWIQWHHPAILDFFFFFFTARDHFCWSWGAGLIASLGTHSLYFIHSAACWKDRALSSLRKLTGSFSVSAPLSGLGYVPYKSKHQLLWPAPSSRSF